jgi:hypothetical protein
MRTTTNNPNPRGDLIGEFGVEPSDLVVASSASTMKLEGSGTARSATPAGLAALYSPD